MEYTNNTLNYNFNNLCFNFDYKNRFVDTSYNNVNNKKFTFNTSFLKVLKPLHISSNKKNIKTNKYIILETSNNLDNKDEFMIIIDKIHEISQENIKKNSLDWFNIELDDFGLDMKVRKPIDNQKNIPFVKIIIGNNKDLLKKISNLEKNTYISMDIQFNGLQVLSDHLIEEWELINFISQEDYDNKITIENTEEQKNNFEELSNLKELSNLENMSYLQEDENNTKENKNNIEEYESNIKKNENNTEENENNLEQNENNLEQNENNSEQNENNTEENENNSEQNENNSEQNENNSEEDESNIKENENNTKEENILEKNKNKNIIIKNNIKYIKRKHKILIW
jgi:hypothetical protein